MEDEIKVKKPRKEKTKAIQVIKPKKEMALSAESLLSQAIDKGVSVETMEKLLAMRRELRAEFAKQEFDKAMSDFQAECPVIAKKQKVDFTSKRTGSRTNYNYATLDEIVRQVKDIIAKHGLSYTIGTKNNEKSIISTVIVRHLAGHSENTEFEVPIDKESYMSAQQQYGAASTFSKRYAFCNAFGILTGDEDKDATPELMDKITEDDEREIISAIDNQPSGTPAKPIPYKLKSSGKKISNADPKKHCPICGQWHQGRYPKCIDCWRKEQNGEKVVQTKTIVNPDAEPFKS